MKHLVFGGDGFLGKQIVTDLLSRGEDVVVCDINQRAHPIYDAASYRHVDIADADAVRRLPISEEDIVYNVAARQLHPMVHRARRRAYFMAVDFDGGRHVIDHALASGCHRVIQFSTDMVYGKAQNGGPIDETHPRAPIGEYSESKKRLEDYAMARRQEGLRVSIFRPRLIIGPGRLGILSKLFGLIRRGLPVPLIGRGENHYQMVSVFDCARAAIISAEKGVVNGEFNLGSANPPTVQDLLGNLIRSIHSRSVLVPLPAAAVKLALRVADRLHLSPMAPEQFEIADDDFLVDISRAHRELGWRPRHGDAEMLVDAFEEFARSEAGR